MPLRDTPQGLSGPGPSWDLMVLISDFCDSGSFCWIAFIPTVLYFSVLDRLSKCYVYGYGWTHQSR